MHIQGQLLLSAETQLANWEQFLNNILQKLLFYNETFAIRDESAYQNQYLTWCNSTN